MSFRGRDDRRVTSPSASRGAIQADRRGSRRPLLSRPPVIVLGAWLLAGAMVGLVGFSPVWTFRPASATSIAAGARSTPDLQQPNVGAQPAEPAPPSAQGLHSIVAFTNQDAADPSRGCGKAAAATLLAAWGKSFRGTTGAASVAALDLAYPYDVAWGLFGTSPRQRETMLVDAGANAGWSTGEQELRHDLAAGYPVIVLEDTGPDWHIVGLHWTVAYAFDATGVYLTNWNGHRSWRLSWPLFREGWDTVLMRGSGVASRFLVITA